MEKDCLFIRHLFFPAGVQLLSRVRLSSTRKNEELTSCMWIKVLVYVCWSFLRLATSDTWPQKWSIWRRTWNTRNYHLWTTRLLLWIFSKLNLVIVTSCQIITQTMIGKIFGLSSKQAPYFCICIKVWEGNQFHLREWTNKSVKWDWNKLILGLSNVWSKKYQRTAELIYVDRTIYFDTFELSGRTIFLVWNILGTFCFDLNMK